MDESVVAAIAKWPNVPAVYGWLSLTGRGEWRLRGEPIGNGAICAFIGRNYASDERGCWFFQNGPQRVFVELEDTPWIWRLGDVVGAPLRAHTGRRADRLTGAWLDERGRLFLQTDIGFGLLDSADAARAAECFRGEDGRELSDEQLDAWLAGVGGPIVVNGRALGLHGDSELSRLQAAEAPVRFGYIQAPSAN